MKYNFISSVALSYGAHSNLCVNQVSLSSLFKLHLFYFLDCSCLLFGLQLFYFLPLFYFLDCSCLFFGLQMFIIWIAVILFSGLQLLYILDCSSGLQLCFILSWIAAVLFFGLQLVRNANDSQKEKYLPKVSLGFTINSKNTDTTWSIR